MSVRCICNICGRGMIPMRPDKEGVLRRIVSGKYEFHEFVCPATPEQHSVQALAGELKRVREALDAYGPDVEDLAERAAAFRREANRADEAIAKLAESEAKVKELEVMLAAMDGTFGTPERAVFDEEDWATHRASVARQRAREEARKKGAEHGE